MKVTFLKNKNKKLEDFKKHEWELIHPEHYGEKLDWVYWKPKKLIVKAEENGKIIGALNGQLIAGVLYITEVIVDHDKRNSGIGIELMKYTEDFARKNKAHLIYLETGKDWKAVKFYEKLGYEKDVMFKKFISKKDFWLMTKYL